MNHELTRGLELALGITLHECHDRQERHCPDERRDRTPKTSPMGKLSVARGRGFLEIESSLRLLCARSLGLVACEEVLVVFEAVHSESMCFREPIRALPEISRSKPQRAGKWALDADEFFTSASCCRWQTAKMSEIDRDRDLRAKQRVRLPRC